MERNKVEIDGEKIILSLFKKYKNETWVLSSLEIDKKRQSWFPGKWGNYAFGLRNHKFGLISGVTIDSYGEFWFLKDVSTYKYEKFNTLEGIRKTFRIHNSTSIEVGSIYIEMSKPEIEFLKEFLDKFSLEVDKKIKSVEDDKKKAKEEEKSRLESLKKSQTNLLKEFDSNGNGIIDVIEGVDDFMILFKKHQKKIIEVDKQYIQKFVKISNYLKTKRQNLQDIFSSIKITKNELQLNENIGILKNQIYTYELLLFHSLNMIISIVEDDLITFYEIYESFDKLNMFNSNWESEVAQQLKNIKDGLSALMYSIDSLERNIVNGLNQLTYVTQEGFSGLELSVTKELQSIDSSIQFNNLLTGISTYQLYRINKQTKPLLPK